jgi:hypothetical protein
MPVRLQRDLVTRGGVAREARLVGRSLRSQRAAPRSFSRSFWSEGRPANAIGRAPRLRNCLAGRPGDTMRSAVATVLALAVLSLTPASALADGDPASDVLLGQNVFYPYSPSVSSSLQNTLNGETAAARRHGFPIKVALIASPVDLGAIPTLFGKPAQYASFLDQEISFAGSGQPLLVVMPNGYGTRHLGAAATRAAASLKPPAGSHGDDLARAAIIAVPELAAAAGHPIGDVTSQTSGSGAGAGVAVALLAVGAISTAAVILAIRRRRVGAP